MEEDGLCEDKDAAGVDTAATLLLGLADDNTGFSDSREIKMQELLIKQRTE